MHRIDGPGATTQHLFTEGDPTQGVPATTVTGSWLNAVQEEVAHVVEGAGLTLDKADNTQLHAAMLALIAAHQQTGFKTGDVKLTMRAAADDGWVICNDGTIGNAESGATTRANDDAHALFALLWANVADGYAPVSGGRGESAEDDWAAGKTISLTRMLGRALAISGAGAGLTPRTTGQYLGEEVVTLTEAQMPLHGHPSRLAITNQGSASAQPNGGMLLSTAGNQNKVAFTGEPAATAGQQIGGTGGDEAHNNMPPTAFLNAMIKL